jgi:hypothetical protein
VDQGQLYTYLNGRFHTRSSKGSYYLMCVYVFVCNAIVMLTMKSRSATYCFATYGGTQQYLTARGFNPKLQTMDNEASTALKRYLTENEVSYQLILLHRDRCYAAGCVIHIFEEHAVSLLATVEPNFPIHLWDHVLPKSVLTFNSLHTPKLHPKMSAEARLFGTFDYNKTHLAPPGSRVIAN